MPLSLRLGDEEELAVREQAAQYKVTVSEYVRMALNDKMTKDQHQQHPYALGEELFGRHASGDTHRAEQVETLLRDKLRRKHAGG